MYRLRTGGRVRSGGLRKSPEVPIPPPRSECRATTMVLFQGFTAGGQIPYLKSSRESTRSQAARIQTMESGVVTPCLGGFSALRGRNYTSNPSDCKGKSAGIVNKFGIARALQKREQRTERSAHKRAHTKERTYPACAPLYACVSFSLLVLIILPKWCAPSVARAG
jgi:hypothetical protein